MTHLHGVGRLEGQLVRGFDLYIYTGWPLKLEITAHAMLCEVYLCLSRR